MGVLTLICNLFVPFFMLNANDFIAVIEFLAICVEVKGGGASVQPVAMATARQSNTNKRTGRRHGRDRITGVGGHRQEKVDADDDAESVGPGDAERDGQRDGQRDAGSDAGVDVFLLRRAGPGARRPYALQPPALRQDHLPPRP